jgi:hypothetical protein
MLEEGAKFCKIFPSFAKVAPHSAKIAPTFMDIE